MSSMEAVERLLVVLARFWKLDTGPEMISMYHLGLKDLSDAELVRVGTLAVQHYRGLRAPRPGDLRDLLKEYAGSGGLEQRLDPALWRWYWKREQFSPGVGAWYEHAWHPGIKGICPIPPVEQSWGVDGMAIPRPP